MKKERAKQFSQEVEHYRRALLWCARVRDWDALKTKAGTLFDYVESVERVELERRFYAVFYIVLGALALAVIALCSVNFGVSPALIGLKNSVMLVALMMSGFELYFFYNYRKYAGVRMAVYQKRRENFIRSIEQDFRGFSTSGKPA